jgi:hypothetical protein
MRAFYDFTTRLKNQLQSQQINTVTIGAMSSIDSAKQTLFPVAHIIMNSATINENTIEFDCMVVFADIVDESKANAKDEVPFYGNNNLHDVYNAMLAEANILSQQMLRGELFSNHTQITAAPTAEPFAERFTNRNLAGWLLSFNASVPNNEICV